MLSMCILWPSLSALNAHHFVIVHHVPQSEVHEAIVTCSWRSRLRRYKGRERNFDPLTPMDREANAYGMTRGVRLNHFRKHDSHVELVRT